MLTVEERNAVIEAAGLKQQANVAEMTGLMAEANDEYAQSAAEAINNYSQRVDQINAN
jgi:hypothetical protein